MAKPLKISLTLGDFTLSLEGEASTVAHQFYQLQTHGLGKLAHIQPKAIKSPQAQFSAPPPSPPTNLTLQSVIAQNTPQTEAEWILVYAHFLTQPSHSKSFTRAQILQSYRTSNRYTRNRSKGLTSNLNLAVKKGWLHPLNNSHYLITSKGRTKLDSLLSSSLP